MSTSWQWFPDTKEAICNYCGFRATYADDFPGHIDHDCDPAQHPPIATPQGLHVGRSPRPETLARVPLDQLLACIHRGPERRQEPCPTCPAGTRIKIFACAMHHECHLGATIIGLRSCCDCGDRAVPRPVGAR